MQCVRQRDEQLAQLLRVRKGLLIGSTATWIVPRFGSHKRQLCSSLSPGLLLVGQWQVRSNMPAVQCKLQQVHSCRSMPLDLAQSVVGHTGASRRACQICVHSAEALNARVPCISRPAIVSLNAPVAFTSMVLVLWVGHACHALRIASDALTGSPAMSAQTMPTSQVMQAV